MKRFLHIAYDAPIRPRAGETIGDQHIIQGGTMVGRVLFDASPCILVDAPDVTVRNCIIEGNGYDEPHPPLLRHLWFMVRRLWRGNQTARLKARIPL